MVPAREDFDHIFFSCPALEDCLRRYLDKYGGIFNTELEKKQFLYTGTVDGGWDSDSRIIAVFNTIFFYCVWQCKLSRRAP